MKSLVVRESTERAESGYASSEVEIKLPVHDTEVLLILPNGEEIICQFRIEGPSIDFCLPEDMPVHNYKGDDLEPALADDPMGNRHIRRAKQLCIPLSKKVLKRCKRS